MAGEKRSKGIVRREEAEKIAVSYTPNKFPQVISRAAANFVQMGGSDGQSSFRIDRIVAEQTGITELERLSIQERVEAEALSRLKSVQEEAYSQAYQLGLDQGREQAFQEKQQEFAARLADLDAMMARIESLKTDLVDFNEAHLVSLVHHIATRVVMSEIENRPELILELMKKTVASAQGDEEVTIRVSRADMEFLQTIQSRVDKELDTAKRVKIEASDEVTTGGCRIETNYGEIDATVEQRLGRVWAAIVEKLPKVEDSIGEGD